MLAFQYPFIPEEDYSSSWKLVYNSTRCSVPEVTSLLQDLINRMRNLHQTKLHMNNNNDNNKKVNLHKFPVQFSRTQLRRQITLKGFHIVHHHVGQMYPPVDASGDQEWYYIRSAWHVVSILVRLTWAQKYPPVEASGGQDQNWVRSSWPELRCTPIRAINTGTQLGLVDMSSDVPFADVFPEHFWFLMIKVVPWK